MASIAYQHLNRVHSAKMNDTLRVLADQANATNQLLESLDWSRFEPVNPEDAENVAKLRDTVSNKNQILEEIKKDLDVNLNTRREGWRETLRTLWLNYKEPTQTMSGVLINYESQVGLTIPKIEGPMFIEDNDGHRVQAVMVKPKLGRMATVSEGGEPNRRDFEYYVSEPLEFNNQVTLPIVEHCITRSQLSKTLDWPTTLRKLLKLGARIGLTRKQLGESIQILTAKILPQHHQSVEMLDDPHKIWEIASTFVDVHTVLADTNRALARVRRHKDTNIAVALREVITINYEKLKIEFPKASPERLMRDAEKACRLVIRDFVSPACWEELMRWQKGRRYTMKGEHDKITMEMIINTISEFEDGHSALKVRDTKMLNKPTENPVGLYNIEDTSAKSLLDEGDFGEEAYDEECFNTEADSEGDTDAPREAVGRTKKRIGYHTRSKGGVPDHSWIMSNSRKSRTGAVKKQTTYQPPAAAPKISASPRPTSRREERERKEDWSRESFSDKNKDGRDSSEQRGGYRTGARTTGSSGYRSSRHRSRDRSTGSESNYRSSRREDSRDRSSSGRETRRRKGDRRSRTRSNSSSRSRTQRPTVKRSKSPWSNRPRWAIQDKKTGDWRSLSRERIHERRSDGTYRPRQISRSRSPSPAREYKKCSTCGRTHSGACNLKDGAVRTGAVGPIPIFNINAKPLN